MAHRQLTAFLLFVLVLFGSSAVFGQALNRDTSSLFAGSGLCQTCHQAGGTGTNVLRSPDGRDISPPEHWRSTMMANAARDPFWRAKVSAEVAAHPELKTVIEDKCTTCHAPMGRTQAIADGQEAYSIAEMAADPLALDGVSCTVCHQIQPGNLGQGESFSGHYEITAAREIFGPYQNPFTNPMIMNVNYTPKYGAHVHESELCATCHTLFTPTVDNSGNIIGQAPEQTPYLEWLNSRFPAEGTECQSCHMPELEAPVVISNRPMMLSARSPFAEHHFVGGNVFMLRILKANAAELGVTATAAHLDSTIARTLRMLQTQTADVTASTSWDGDTLVLKVVVKNKTGHKFPSAYPSRRAWLEVHVVDGSGKPVFASGAWDPSTGEVEGLDEGFEPHYNVIRSEDQVQIYEAVMTDVDGEVNYTLLRAAGFLKDNRIPPEGFHSGGPAYDSTRVEGLAAQDPNFNRRGGVEGTGADEVEYRVGGLDPGASYTVTVKLNYQTFKPRFVADLFRYNTPEVTLFKGYYSAADKSPVVVDSLSFAVTATSVGRNPELPSEPQLSFRVYPNPVKEHFKVSYSVGQAGELRFRLFDLLGRPVAQLGPRSVSAGTNRLSWTLEPKLRRKLTAGTYFLLGELVTSAGQTLRKTEKVLIVK